MRLEEDGLRPGLGEALEAARSLREKVPGAVIINDGIALEETRFYIPACSEPFAAAGRDGGWRPVRCRRLDGAAEWHVPKEDIPAAEALARAFFESVDDRREEIHWSA